MKLKLLFLLIIISIFQTAVFSQQTPAAEWIRVRSDNSEFSIEVPVKHNYFYDKDGFLAAKERNEYWLKEMNLIKAYTEKTLLSVETYKAGKGAIETFYRDDDKLSDIHIGGIKGKQYVYNKDNVYFTAIYLATKDYLYVVTASSKNRESAVMKRFLDSIVFNAQPDKSTASAVPFSLLKVSQIEVKIKLEDIKKQPKSGVQPKTDDPNKLQLLSKPRPSYTESARMRQVQGTIRLKVDFSEDGYIPKIEVLQTLPEGLLRQTIFAAIRIKFLPEEEKGIPTSISKKIEYSFAIY